MWDSKSERIEPKDLVEIFPAKSKAKVYPIKMKPKTQVKKNAIEVGDQRLYTLEVFIFNGPMTKKFIKQNPVVSRTIQIRGDQTLENLHRVIFHAFNREEEHMYEFRIGGERPNDPQAKRYVLPGEMDEGFSKNKPAGVVTRATIDSLGLKVGQAFGYWFDFGDDWWHQINVVAIEDKITHGKYPRVIKRVGESPPQYMGWDEERE